MSRKTRAHRQQAEEAPSEEIEVLDAPEEEAPAYATVPAPDVKEADEDPYEVLQRNFDAVNKQKADAEERAREESLRRESAERQRDELGGKVSQHAISELEAHKALIQSEYTKTEHEIASAEAAYAHAMEAGDYQSAAKAQRAMVRIEGKLTQLEGMYVNVEDKIKNPPRQAQPAQSQQVDEFERGIQQLPKPLQEWAREHEEDLRKRTDVALAVGNLAVKKGLQPGSDAYLDFMDEQMGYASAGEAEPAPQPEPVAVPKQQTKRRVPLAAPVVSGSSGGDASKVYLTAQDKKWAKEAGLSEVEYAKFKRDAPNSSIAKKFAMQVNTRQGSR